MFGEYTPFRACQVHQIQVTERCGLSDDKIDGIEAGGSVSLGVCHGEGVDGGIPRIVKDVSRPIGPPQLTSPGAGLGGVIPNTKGHPQKMASVCPSSGAEQTFSRHIRNRCVQ